MIILNDFVLANKNKTNVNDGDQLKIPIDYLEPNHLISTGKTTFNQATNPIADLAEYVLNILTSDELISLNECTFNVEHISIPQGQGRSKIVNLDEDSKTKKSITKILNEDNLCVPRTIIPALTYGNG